MSCSGRSIFCPSRRSMETRGSRSSCPKKPANDFSIGRVIKDSEWRDFCSPGFSMTAYSISFSALPSPSYTQAHTGAEPAIYLQKICGLRHSTRAFVPCSKILPTAHERIIENSRNSGDGRAGHSDTRIPIRNVAWNGRAHGTYIIRMPMTIGCFRHLA